MYTQKIGIAILLMLISFPFSFGVATATSVSCDTVCEEMQTIKTESSYIVKVFSSGEKAGLGTGFLYKDEEGRWGIYTNNHVVGSPPVSFAWVLFRGERFARKVRIIGRDIQMDIALLEAPTPLPRFAKSAEIDFSHSLRAGERVYALGNPFGIYSVSVGRINSTTYQSPFFYFSTQAPLNHGNSGGPLFRFLSDGTKKKPVIIGINTAIASTGLLSLSIRLDYALRVLPRLWREGTVSHAKIGIMFSDSKDISPSVFEKISGVEYPPQETKWPIVGGVEPGSPAMDAGMRIGDSITELYYQGIRYPFQNTRELKEIIFFEFRLGDEIVLVIKRGDKTIRKNIVLGEFNIPKSQ